MTVTTMSGLAEPFLLLLLLSGVSAAELGSVLVGTFNQVPVPDTWQAAQNFCRSLSSSNDLVTFHTQSDVDLFHVEPLSVWVGLHTIGLNQWTWVNGQYLDTSRTVVLSTVLPVNACAYYSYFDQKFYSSDCANNYFFICSMPNENSYVLEFINQTKSWEDALLYCRRMSRTLAVSDNVTQLTAAVSQQDFPLWTGLYRDGGTWKWSAGVSDYRRWASNEPGDNGDCVAISSVSRMMTTQNCSAMYPFICYMDNLMVVKEKKTWEEALNYCTAVTSPIQTSGPYQLVSVQPGDDFTYMMDKAKEADTEEVWTGLRFLAGDWFWTNGADVLLSDLPSCPLSEHNCGAFSQSNNDSLEPRDCSETKNFMCYSLW